MRLVIRDMLKSLDRYLILQQLNTQTFLAPTGAQEVIMSVLSGTSLSRALNLHLSSSDLQANFMRTSSSQSAVI